MLKQIWKWLFSLIPYCLMIRYEPYLAITIEIIYIYIYIFVSHFPTFLSPGSVFQAVEWPFLYPNAFSRLGLSRPRGILLYGPPGCSKTTLVRAAATSCHCTFLSLSCAQLYSPYVGDAERLIREVSTITREGVHSARRSWVIVVGVSCSGGKSLNAI